MDDPPVRPDDIEPVDFYLDSEQYHRAVDVEKPRCSWNYKPRFDHLKKVWLPGYDCPNEPVWEFHTTFANASKHDSITCELHGQGMHEDVLKWSYIDHNTISHTMVINIATQEKCCCVEGDECDSVRARRSRQVSVALPERLIGSNEHWSS